MTLPRWPAPGLSAHVFWRSDLKAVGAGEVEQALKLAVRPSELVVHPRNIDTIREVLASRGITDVLVSADSAAAKCELLAVWKYTPNSTPTLLDIFQTQKKQRPVSSDAPIKKPKRAEVEIPVVELRDLNDGGFGLSPYKIVKLYEQRGLRLYWNKVKAALENPSTPDAVIVAKKIEG